MLAIMELVADEDEDDNEQGASAEWISLVDRDLVQVQCAPTILALYLVIEINVQLDKVTLH